jgi:lauroyl/myristoyl acyltransferase
MLVKENPLRDVSRLIVWYPFRRLCRILPVRFSFAMFRLMGRIHELLSPGTRHRLQANMKRAFPDKPDAEISAQIAVFLQNHYADRLHIFVYPKLKNPIHYARIAELSGLDNLEKSLEKGKGAILALGH